MAAVHPSMTARIEDLRSDSKSTVVSVGGAAWQSELVASSIWRTMTCLFMSSLALQKVGKGWGTGALKPTLNGHSGCALEVWPKSAAPSLPTVPRHLWKSTGYREFRSLARLQWATHKCADGSAPASPVKALAANRLHRAAASTPVAGAGRRAAAASGPLRRPRIPGRGGHRLAPQVHRHRRALVRGVRGCPAQGAQAHAARGLKAPAD